MSSSYSVYKRLLTCARPYWVRLAIGLSASFVVAFAMVGAFRFSKNLLVPFSGPAKVQAAPAENQPGAVPDKASPPAIKSRFNDFAGVQKILLERLDVETTTPDGRMTKSYLMITLLGLPLFLLLKAAATYVNRYYMRWVGARVVLDLRNRVFANLQHQSLSYHGRCDIGNLVSRCTHDITQIERAVSQTIADLTRCPLEIIACLGFVVYATMDSGLGGLLPGLAILFGVIILPIVIIARFIKTIYRRALKQIAGLVSRMQETLSGIRVVKAFHMEDQEIARFQNMNRRYFKSIIRAVRLELMINPMMEVVAITAICIGAVMCYQHQVVLADLGPVLFAVFAAYRPLKQMAKINVNIQRSTAAAERIFELVDLDTQLPEAPNPLTVNEFKQGITFDHVRLQYTPEEPWIIDDLSFELKRGEMIAFVGETGSGKTTVANLLARFYDPSEGGILLDGIDLRHIKIASLRQMIGVVNQETILFNDTVANNIAYGTPTAGREDIIAAAKQANAHEFIMENPEGYERNVGEKGFVLSGGQRQRIAIARAILRNPPILILDEATSALDTVTERLVQEALSHLMENRTVFAIAHRLSTIKHADQICLLEKGRIIERGTHDELYAQGGHYRHLCDIQFN